MGNASRGAVSRRSVLVAMPGGALLAASGRAAHAQPAAADPVSFYLGQVLALATLQAEAIRRLRPFLAAPAPQDGDWQSTTTAEASVIGAVASVLGAMEPPAELTASVGELRLASTAYQSAADAAQNVALGDTAALTAADAGLAEGAGHILLWLDALTAETGNDWGDGLRTLTLGAAPVPVVDLELQPPADAALEPVPEDPGDGELVVVEPETESEADPKREMDQGQGQGRNRQNRQDRQAQQEEQGNQANRQERQNRRNRPNREGRVDG